MAGLEDTNAKASPQRDNWNVQSMGAALAFDKVSFNELSTKVNGHGLNQKCSVPVFTTLKHTERQVKRLRKR